MNIRFNNTELQYDIKRILVDSYPTYIQKYFNKYGHGRHEIIIGYHTYSYYDKSERDTDYQRLQTLLRDNNDFTFFKR